MDSPKVLQLARGSLPPSRGVPGVLCPSCGEKDTLLLHLHDARIECGNCAEELSADDLRLMARKLLAMADWIDAIPAEDCR